MASDEGILILATQSDATSPPAAWTRVHVAGPTNLACGHFHYIAIGQAGVYAWGRGPLGVLGHGGEDDEARPRIVDVLAGEAISSVSAGPYHSAAVTSDGRLFMWGWMPFAPTATGMEETFSRVPRQISLDGAVRVNGIACGCFATAAWDARGQLFTWGRSDSGQLGHGADTSAASPRPVEALIGVRVAQVAFGGVQTAEENTGFMLVRSEAGVLFSCGSPKRGRLGRPYSLEDLSLTQAYEDEPVHHGIPGEVALGPEAALASKIATADNHAAALTLGGVPYVWGANDAGLLGLELSADDADEPLPISGLPPISQLVCTAYSTAFLADSGELLLLGGDPNVLRPRLAGLPGHISGIFGGGHHLGVMLLGLAPGASSTALATAEQQAEEQARLDTPKLLQHEAFDDSVDKDIAELLLADVAGATPLQLRHELRLLRDLLGAERAKLHAIQHGEPAPVAGVVQVKEKSPSEGTWIDAGTMTRQPITNKETQYTMALGMDTKASGMMYVAKQSILSPTSANLADRQAMTRAQSAAAMPPTSA